MSAAGSRQRELLARIRAALGDSYPVLSAGGVADAGDARARLDSGAEAVVCGTRFLMSEESGAHPAYKARLTEAKHTVLTELFGVGWPAPHRVVPNEATARWLRGDPRGPRWLRVMHRATAPFAPIVPVRVQIRLAASQRPDRPVFGPAAATAGGPPNLVEAGPLYAGRVHRPHRRHPAGGRTGPGTVAVADRSAAEQRSSAETPPTIASMADPLVTHAAGRAAGRSLCCATFQSSS